MIKNTALVLAALMAGVSAQAAAASVAAPASSAKDSALSVTTDITYVSDYVFRGQRLNTASIQPSIEATYGDFYAGAWNNSGISSQNDSQIDLYAGYGYKVTDVLSLDAGVTRYTFNGGSSFDSTEVYVGAKADVLLSPTFYYYFNTDSDTFTFEASIGYSVPVDAIKASIDFSAKGGMVANPKERNNQDYSYGLLGVAIPYKLSDTATLTVGADYVVNDSKVLANFASNKAEILVGKVGLSIGF